MSQINFFIAFLAGSVSFFAPCVIPLVPAFLSYLAGQTLDKTSRLVVFGHSILFVLGFSTIFAILGVLLNSVLASIAYTTQIWLGRITGTIIIFFGLYLLGLIKPKFLEKEYKIRAHKFNSKALTSFMFGAAFAVGRINAWRKFYTVNGILFRIRRAIFDSRHIRTRVFQNNKKIHFFFKIFQYCCWRINNNFRRSCFYRKAL